MRDLATRAYSNILLTVIAACLLWLCIANAEVIQSARAQQEKQPTAEHRRVVEAEEFKLVDASGKLRARLTIHPGEKAQPYFEDQPGHYLYNQQGVPAGVFRLTDNLPEIVLSDGKCRAELGITKTQPNGDHGGYVVVTDAERRGAVLGVHQEYHTGPGPASSLKIFNEQFKKVVWQAP